MEIRPRAKAKGADALLVFYTKRAEPKSSIKDELEKVSKKGIEKLFQLGFKAQPKDAEILLLEKAPWKLAVITGLGKEDKLELENFRKALASGIKKIQNYSVKSLEIEVPQINKFEEKEILRAIAETLWFATYKYKNYKTNSKTALQKIWLLTQAKKANEIINKANIIGKEHSKIRDLINTPGSDLGPEEFSQLAKESAKELGLKLKIYNEKELARMGYNGILRVGQGSKRPPRLIVLEWQGAGRSQKPICLVGKGVTFDSGGISLKRSDGMEKMKYDMAGAGAAFGTICTCARLGIKKNITAVIPLVENMPSGSAQRPGDIVKMADGTTVEVISTDAEGRMILADALYHSQKFNPRQIIDLATLTGSATIALGRYAIALLGNNEKLLSALCQAGERSGERCWILPLWEDYNELVRSEVADIRNVGRGREAGTIVGAVFLKRFIKNDIAWAHLDIASCAWSDENHPYLGKGATGVGLRLLVRYLEDFAF